MAKKPTTNAEAHRLYLLGRYHFVKNTRQGWATAIHYYEKALQVDPNYALAYCGLADVYGWMGGVVMQGKEAWAKGKDFSEKALALDPDLADAHLSLGIALGNAFDWPGCEKEFKRALELNPNLPLAYDQQAWLLTLLGRFDEALRVEQKALELDPLNPSLNFNFGANLYLARRYDEAIAQLRRTLELDPNYAYAHAEMGWCLAGKHEPAAAIVELQKAKSLDDLAPFDGGLSYSYALNRDRAKAEQILDQLNNAKGYLVPEAYAFAYIGLGDKTKALDWLEKSYGEQGIACWWLKVDPIYDRLRNEPRFQALLRKVFGSTL